LNDEEKMKIKQSIQNEVWMIEIDFESYTFTNGNGPYYIGGDFNHWNKTDPQYQIPAPYGGANNLISLTLKLPGTTTSLEFKVFNSRGDNPQWVEPSTDKNMYRGEINLVKNSFGTFNVKVIQKKL